MKIVLFFSALIRDTLKGQNIDIDFISQFFTSDKPTINIRMFLQILRNIITLNKRCL